MDNDSGSSCTPPDVMRELAHRYATAKSSADVEGALACCGPDFVLASHGFDLAAHGIEAVRIQLQAFFQVFPDYAVELDGEAIGDQTVTCWGRASMTMKGTLVDIPPTGRRATVPFVSVFAVRGGRLASEGFYFDLATLSRGLGLDVDRVDRALDALRVGRGAAGRGAAA